MKKILFVVISFLAIGLLSFANFNNSYTAFASESTIIDEDDIINTYTYSDSTCEEYYGTSANAIDNVVSANIKYTIDFKVIFKVNKIQAFEFLTYGLSGSNYGVSSADGVLFSIWDDSLYSKIPTNLNIQIKRLDSSSNSFWVIPNYVDFGNGYRLMKIELYSGGTYEMHIRGYRDNLSSGLDGSSGEALVLNSSCNSIDSIVDMLSTSNLEIFNCSDLSNINTNKYTATFSQDNLYSSSYTYCRSLLDCFSSNDAGFFRPELFSFHNLALFDISSYDNNLSSAFQKWYDSNYSVGDGWLYNVSNDIMLTTYGAYDYKGKVCCLFNTDFGSQVNGDYVVNDVSYNLDIVDFDILIDMPTYRSQNSLILYNYDYDSMLKYTNNVTYRLYRDRCFYDIVYNGSIPNKQTLIIDNANIQNKTFSNYIFLDMDFNQIEIPESGILNAGFDFNFGNFIEPFPQITSNNSKQTFDRPPLPTDLTPRLNFEKTDSVPWFKISLYFPVIKYVEYAFLWLLFYAPVVGDCTAFLYTFFNKFLAIFNIVLDLPMGTFVLSFIAFILCFKLFASFLPFASDRVNFTFKNISNNISNKRKENKQFEEKIKKQNLKKDLLKKKSKKIIRKEFKKFDKYTKKKFK